MNVLVIRTSSKFCLRFMGGLIGQIRHHLSLQRKQLKSPRLTGVPSTAYDTKPYLVTQDGEAFKRIVGHEEKPRKTREKQR